MSNSTSPHPGKSQLQGHNQEFISAGFSSPFFLSSSLPTLLPYPFLLPFLCRHAAPPLNPATGLANKCCISSPGRSGIIGHITDGFLRVKWPNQQFQSTERRYVLRIRLQSHQVHPTVITIIQQLCSMKQKHTKYSQINTNISTHSEMGPVWQNPIQRTVRTAHLSVLMTVHSFSTQYNTEQFW